MSETVSVDEAIRLVRKYSWEEYTSKVTCGHPGCEDHRAPGRRMIHTYSMFGCDLSIEDVEKRIHQAEKIVWADHLLHHDLAIVGRDGSVLRVDIRRPEPAL